MPATWPASEASSVGRPGDRPHRKRPLRQMAYPRPQRAQEQGARRTAREGRRLHLARGAPWRLASVDPAHCPLGLALLLESDARDMLPRGTAGQPCEGDARPNHPNAETTASRQIVALLTMKICYPALSSPQGHIDDRTSLRSNPRQLQRPPPLSGDSFRVRQLRPTRPGGHLCRPAATERS